MTEWTKTQSGRLDHSIRHQTGFIRKEIIDPRLNGVRIIDKYPDAVRYLYEFGDSVDPDVMHFQELKKNAGIVFPKIFFKENGGQIAQEIMVTGKEGFEVTIRDNPELQGYPFTSGVGGYVLLEYRPDGLTNIILEAEPSILIKHENAPKNLQEALTTLISYLRSSSPEDIYAYKQASSFAYEVALDKFPSPEHPIVKEAQQKAEQLINHLLNIIPLEDRTEASRMFEDVHWNDLLTERLLLEVELGEGEIHEILQKINTEKFLISFVTDEIEIRSPETLFHSSLHVEKFSGNTFQYKEVSKEEFTASGEDKIDTKPETTAYYGDKINLQGDTFVINKEDNFIEITCHTKTKKVWKVRVPFMVPVYELKAIIENKDGDFRAVRNVLQINFELPI